MVMKIHAFYFSPTHTTEQLAEQVGERIKNALSGTLEKISLTKPAARGKTYSIPHEDIFLLALPVYGGRIPALLETTLRNIKGNNSQAIIIGVYGNRDFDDALLEMKDLLTENSFHVTAAGAFVGEHSFSRRLAANRPDGQDMIAASEFATKCAEKILAKEKTELQVKGNYPYKERNPAAPIAPKTTDDCNACMICFNACPTQAISGENPKIADNKKCIKCFACVKSCPLSAKYFDDENILKATVWLENSFMDRKEPEFFF